MTFETFFDEHYEAVRRSLAVAFGDPVIAEELAQDAFTRALSNWRRVAQMDRPAGWVYVVAFAPAAPGETARVVVVPGAGEPRHRGRRHARCGARTGDPRLPERQRLALVLRYRADLPVADVARAMDCAVGTVKSTLHAALERLGVEMREQEEPDAAR